MGLRKGNTGSLDYSSYEAILSNLVDFRDLLHFSGYGARYMVCSPNYGPLRVMDTALRI